MQNKYLVILATATLLLVGCTDQVYIQDFLVLETERVMVLMKNAKEAGHDYQKVSVLVPGTSEFTELYTALHPIQFERTPVKFHPRAADYVLKDSLFTICSFSGGTVLKVDGRTYTADASLNDLLSKFITSNDYAFTDFYGRGAFEEDSYTWCGVVSTFHEYAYKKGHWTFWSKDFRHIGSGPFRVAVDTIDFYDECGVPKVVKRSKIDSEAWDWSADARERPELTTELENIKRIDTAKVEIPVAWN